MILFTIIYLGLCLSFTLIYDLEPNMPCAQAPHSSPSSLPLAVPEKKIFYSPTASQVPISRYITSRPQPGSSANTSAAPSLTSCSNTCRTTTDYETQNRAYPRIDLAEMLKTRLSSDMDTLALDRSLVRQAQTWVTFSHRPYSLVKISIWMKNLVLVSWMPNIEKSSTCTLWLKAVSKPPRIILQMAWKPQRKWKET